MLTHAIPPSFSDGVHLIYRQSPSGQSRLNPVTPLYTDEVHCRESAGTGSVVLKEVRVKGAAFSGVTKDDFFVRISFPTPPIIDTVCSGDVMCDTESIRGDLDHAVQ